MKVKELIEKLQKSDEEKEAIKILSEFRDYYAREDINRENFNNEENYKKALNGIKILKNSFDTVINLVTRLQKENKELKHDNRILLDEEKNYIYTEQVHNNQIQQLKKQIDLMGEVIFENFKAQLVIEYGIENKEQFIKLFEKKIKE